MTTNTPGHSGKLPRARPKDSGYTPPPADIPGRRLLDDPAWVSSENPSGTLTDSELAAATEYMARARDNEPGITDRVQAMAEATGAEMIGLEARLKTDESFRRKLADELMENDYELEPSLADMKDAVRYTASWSTDDYTAGVQAAKQNLLDQGFEPVKWKPTWGEGYKGVNSFWQDPATGQKFEVQFHTPESFDAKTETHKLYDRIRVLPEGNPERVALEAKQNEIFGSVPIPPGASGL